MRWLVFVLVACWGCGVDENVDLAPPTLPGLSPRAPDEPGPYAIGVTTIQTDAGPGGDRMLPVEVWYPALPADGAQPAMYELSLGVLVLGGLPSPLGAVRDARADMRGAPHPVIVFSHGFGGLRFQSFYLTEYLATHGFVVVAPDHVGNTFAEQVASANAIPAAEMAVLRPGDVSRALDAILARSADVTDRLAWTSDASRVGVAGHSFGGYTAFRVVGARADLAGMDVRCAEPDPPNVCDGWGEQPFPESAGDARFMAALPQAPGGAAVFGATGLDAVDVPVQIQGGTADQTTPFAEEAQAPYDALGSPAALVAIADAGHFTFSDLCEMLEVLDIHDEAFDDGCGPENVDTAVAHAIIVRYATAFFQVHVAGEATFAAMLNPATPPPGAALSAK